MEKEQARAKAQAKNAKMNKGQSDQTAGDKKAQQLNNADIMREKQRIAQAKKDGTYVEEVVEVKKTFDTSYLNDFAQEEEKQPAEEEKKQESDVIQPKGKKGKKNK